MLKFNKDRVIVVSESDDSDSFTEESEPPDDQSKVIKDAVNNFIKQKARQSLRRTITGRTLKTATANQSE